MTMAEDPNDVFADMVKDVVLTDPSVDAIDYTQLGAADLIVHKGAVRSELERMGQLDNLNAGGIAAELHSKLAAIELALKKRLGRL